MASLTKLSISLVAMAIARLTFAGEVLFFPNSDCNKGGYYDTIDSGSTCSKTYLRSDDYKKVDGDPNAYQVWFDLQTDEGDGCAIVIGQDSNDAKSPPCGECTILLHNENKCVQANLPVPFYAWECCGDDCQNQCGQTPGKRSVNVTEVKELPSRTVDNIANLKNRPILSAPLAKRSDCSFKASGKLYSQAGNPQKVSNTFQPCESENGCQVQYSGMVESSFSQTFDISETTEAGFFDVVSESVTFGYSSTYEKSQSVSVSATYTFNQGQGGYLTFSPLSQCTTGTFSGSDCKAMGIPTGGDARNACVPEKIAKGQINGDINVVTAV